jgi:lipopolysaccharide/colanic/teichoic acid biosynthesis glycosyltransferase
MTVVALGHHYEWLKRVADILMAGIGLVVASPALAVVACLVAVKLGRPIIFRQNRLGKSGEVFSLCKFRTMRSPEGNLGLVSDAQRLTPFGLALRSTSLDELPTLINVLRGDMSIVGPRPLLTQYLDRYNFQQARRHEVRPGVTGLAQVSGRNLLSWEEKFELDVEYVDTRTAKLDVNILLCTVRSVLKREGISANDHVTTAEFLGSASDREFHQ